jgi:hypothetical protein
VDNTHFFSFTNDTLKNANFYLVIMKKRYITLIVVSSLIVVMVSAFFIWVSVTYKPMDEALEALNSTEYVEVTIDDYILFTPINTTPTEGLIFYPGGKVEPEAYAPLMMAIAEYGYLVAIVPMPLNLAFFSPNKGDIVIEDHPSITRWIISGHSLGGAMAARYAYNNPSRLVGLILYAGYPADSDDMSSYTLEVLVIYGTENTNMVDNIDAKLLLLPSGTTVIVIEGGNHAYFGYYGEQRGDGEATITREEQHAIALNATTVFLASL